MNAEQAGTPTDGATGPEPTSEGQGTWTSSEATGARRLTRRSEGRIVAGVASGIADYLRIDPTVLRIGFVLLAIFGSGLGLVLYLVAWATMPSPNGSEPLAETILRKGRDAVQR